MDGEQAPLQLATKDTAIKTDTPAGDPDKEVFTQTILSLDVPKTSPDDLTQKIKAGQPLTQPDKNTLVCELATCPPDRLSRILIQTWAEYLVAYPHLKQITSKINPAEYNPFLTPPAKISVIPNLTSVASMALDNSTLSQGVSEATHRQIMVTQMLSPDFNKAYPPILQENPEHAYRVWPHEAGHTVLNPGYKQIVDTADRLEAERNPGHLTIGSKVGKFGAITAFQEAVVEMAASEITGTQVTTLPNKLLGAGYVTVLSELRAQAGREGHGGDDNYVLDLWYKTDLRKEVGSMCRAIVEARLNGVNPLDLGEEVNRVISIALAGNPNMHHEKYTYATVTDIINTVIRTDQVQPSMPKLDIKAEDIDVFIPQRLTLVQAIANQWLESQSAQ